MMSGAVRNRTYRVCGKYQIELHESRSDFAAYATAVSERLEPLKDALFRWVFNLSESGYSIKATGMRYKILFFAYDARLKVSL